MRRVRSRAWYAALGFLSLSSAGCDTKKNAQPASPSAASPPASASAPASVHEAEAIARAALAPFKKELKEILTKALAEGPMAAVSVCAAVAPQLAKRASSERVAVGRSALRLRNPDNAPQAWLKPLMEELAHLPSAEGQYRVRSIGGGRYGYAEAIVLQPPCVLCHGQNIAPDLAALITARYPSDQATGFAVGQLRGVFWAEVTGAAAPAKSLGTAP